MNILYLSLLAKGKFLGFTILIRIMIESTFKSKGDKLFKGLSKGF